MSVQKTASQEWKEHWPLVLAACIGFSFMSLMTPAIGVFMAPLSEAFGWSRTTLTMGQASSAVLSLFFAPFIGVAIDRFGPRKLAIPGLILLAAFTALFATLNGSIAQWMGFWLAWGMASLLVQSTLWSTAVANAFVSARGLALGVTLSGTALAQVIVPPLTNWLMEGWGWRTAFVGLGLGWGSVALLLTVLFLRESRSKANLAAARKGYSNEPGLSIRDAWRDSSLWRIAIATFLILSITIAVTVHQIPIYRAAGVGAANAAWLASLSGVAGIIGKLVTGSLIDRYHARWVGGITLASTAIAYPLMMEAAGAPGLIVAACMISGYAAGTKIQLCGYLTSRYAGMRNYGAVFGFMTSMIALSSAVGPLLGGVAYDRWGNYDVMLVVGIVLSLISSALIFSLGAYPAWDNRRAD